MDRYNPDVVHKRIKIERDRRDADKAHQKREEDLQRQKCIKDYILENLGSMGPYSTFNIHCDNPIRWTYIGKTELILRANEVLDELNLLGRDFQYYLLETGIQELVTIGIRAVVGSPFGTESQTSKETPSPEKQT